MKASYTKDPLAKEQAGRKVLTDHEVDTLMLVAEGNTTKEIADIQKLSTRTIEARLQKIKNKLKAKSIPNAILLCVRYEIIK